MHINARHINKMAFLFMTCDGPISPDNSKYGNTPVRYDQIDCLIDRNVFIPEYGDDCDVNVLRVLSLTFPILFYSYIFFACKNAANVICIILVYIIKSDVCAKNVSNFVLNPYAIVLVKTKYITEFQCFIQFRLYTCIIRYS